MTFAEELTSGL